MCCGLQTSWIFQPDRPIAFRYSELSLATGAVSVPVLPQQLFLFKFVEFFIWITCEFLGISIGHSLMDHYTVHFVNRYAKNNQLNGTLNIPSTLGRRLRVVSLENNKLDQLTFATNANLPNISWVYLTRWYICSFFTSMMCCVSVLLQCKRVSMYNLRMCSVFMFHMKLLRLCSTLLLLCFSSAVVIPFSWFGFQFWNTHFCFHVPYLLGVHECCILQVEW